MVYVVCVYGWNACVYSVNWVGVLCNVGLVFLQLFIYLFIFFKPAYRTPYAAYVKKL